MLKKYIGPDSPVSVTIAGNEMGYVETGEILVVDDEVANSVGWAPENWVDVEAPAQEPEQPIEFTINEAGN